MSNLQYRLLSEDELREVAKFLAQHLSKVIYVRYYDREAHTFQITFVSALDKNKLVEVLNLEKYASTTAEVFDITSWIVNAVQRVVGNLLKTFFKDIVQWFVTSFEYFYSTVRNVFVQFGRYFIETITEGLEYLYNIAATTFRKFGRYVLESIYSWLRWAQTSAADWFYGFVEFISKYVLEPIWNFVNKIFESVKEIPKYFETLSNGINNILTTISGFVNPLLNIWNVINEVYNGFINAVKSAFVAEVPKAISSFFTTVINFFKDLPQHLLEIGKWFSVVADFFRNLWNKISDYIEGFFKGIPETIQEFWESVRDYIGGFFKDIPNILNSIGSTFKNICKIITDIFEKAKDAIIDFFTSIPEKFASFVEVFKNIYNFISEKFKEFIEGALGFFKDVKEGLEDFIESLKNIGEIFENLPQNLANAFINIFKTINLLEFFKFLYDSMTKVFVSFGNLIISFIKDITKGFVSVVSTFASEITEFFLGISQQITKNLVNFFKGVGGTLGSFFSGLYDIVVEIFRSIYEWFFAKFKETTISSCEAFRAGRAGEYNFVFQILSFFAASLGVVSFVYFAKENLKDAIRRLMAYLSIRPLGIGFRVRIPAGLFNFLLSAVDSFINVGQEIIRSVPLAFTFWVVEPFRRVLYACPVLRNTFPIEIPTVTEGRRMIQRFMPFLVMGGEATKIFYERFEWYKQWLAYRGYHDKIIEMFATALPSLAEEEKRRIDWRFVTVTDRFGKPRVFPTSMIYDLPTHSELVRMMLRDIFAKPDDFIKAITMRGMYEDVAFLYYLLHFRYPSPRDLWRFYCRSLTGMLWVGETLVTNIEKELIEKKGLGAYPKAPIDLNFKADLVFQALGHYMKWHDLFFASWFTQEQHGFVFTSDRLIRLDVAAELPLRTDVRWALRWQTISQLFEALGEQYQFFKRFIPRFVSREQVAENLDVILSQLIAVARGIHPEWIGIIGITEYFNNLMAERTLLRTGFINLYRYGFWDAKAFNTFLAGIFKVPLRILVPVYRDGKFAHAFETKEVEIGVRWLRGQRVLLGYRAIMDRYMYVLREAWRDLIRAVADHVLPVAVEFKVEEGRLKIHIKEEVPISKVPVHYIQAITEVVSQRFVDELNEITKEAVGKEIPPEVREKLKIKVVPEYYRELVRAGVAMMITRKYWRLRRFLRYMLWVLYRRIQRGYFPREKAEAIFDYIARNALLTGGEPRTVEELVKILNTSERDFLKQIGDYLWEMAKTETQVRSILTLYRRHLISREEAIAKLTEIVKDREYAEALVDHVRISYVPTPRGMAYFLELVPEARDVVDKVIELRGVPDWLKDHFKKFILRRPTHDEARMLRTWLIVAYARGAISWQEFVSEIEKLKPYGFDEGEIELIKKIAEVRRKIYAVGVAVRKWTPTPSGLALMSEILDGVINKETLDKLIKVVIETRNIHDAFVPIIDEYVKRRIAWRWIRRVATTLANSFSYELINEEQLRSGLKDVASPYNIDWIVRYAKLRHDYVIKRRLLRFFTPTIRQLGELFTLDKIARKIAELEGRAYEFRIEEFVKSFLPNIKTYPELKKNIVELAKAWYSRAIVHRAFRYYIYAYAYEGISRDQLTNILAQWSPDYETKLWLFVADSYKAFRDAVEKRRIERLRDAVTRWLQRTHVRFAIYAFAREVINREELTNILKKYLTSDQITIATEIAELRRRIYRARKWIPTPSGLAVISEIVPEAIKYVDLVLKERNVHEQLRDVVKKYVELRRYIDDVRRLIRTYVRAFEYGVISRDDLIAVLSEFAKYGIDETERNLILREAELRYKIRTYALAIRYRPYIPTPLGLIRLIEYYPKARQLIDFVLKARNVPTELQDMYRELAKYRPLIDELRRLLNEHIMAYARNLITYSELETFLNTLKNYGWENGEIDLIKKFAELRRKRTWSRIYILTPSGFARLAEVVPEVKKEVDKLFEYVKVPDFLKNYIIKYIGVRPVLDDIRRTITYLLRAFEIGAYTVEKWNREIEELKKLGWEPAEIHLLNKMRDLRRGNYVITRVVPTIARFVYYAQFTPLADVLLKQRLDSLLKEAPIEENLRQALYKLYDEVSRNRRLRRWVNRIVYTLVRIFRYGGLTEDELRAELSKYKQYGLRDDDINLIVDWAKYERIYQLVRELYG